MSDKLNIALVQANLYWQQPDANRAHLEELIWQIHKPVDIIVLPEMFTTGFTMEAHACAEPMHFHTCRWMRLLASQQQAVITGSVIIEEKKQYYNRLLWVTPSGEVYHYDKRHLFRMVGEHEVYTAGHKLAVFTYKQWRIAPFICYDLRFPVWSRNVDLMYDVALYVANWPAMRIQAWDILLAARAIENLCYVVGVNRVGEDDTGVCYPGHSAVYDFRGRQLAFAKQQETILYCQLDKTDLQTFRQKFPAHADTDHFMILDYSSQEK